MAARVILTDGRTLIYRDGNQFKTESPWLVVRQQGTPDNEMIEKVRLDTVSRYEFQAPGVGRPARRRRK